MKQSDISDIKLTTSRNIVLKQILDFVDLSKDRVFILKGYAGTGKTMLMRFLIKALAEREKHYRLLASTGRVAKVLANLSEANGQISTIQSMVYEFNGLNKEYEEKEEPKADKDGQLFLVFEPSKLDKDANPETVYILVPRNITLNPTKEAYQWVYTSMTRARKTLHMIDDFYLK